MCAGASHASAMPYSVNPTDTVELNLGNDTTLCEGGDHFFDAATLGATTYLWSTGETDSLLKVEAPGTYSVVATGDCLYATDTINITFFLISETLDTFACPGDSIFFGGIFIHAGTAAAFPNINALGCDSTYVVDVIEAPVYDEEVELQFCEGDQAIFDGQVIPEGTDVPFTYQSEFGCDSLITVSSFSVTNIQTDSTVLVCPNETVFINGESLTAGDVQVTPFPLTGQSCDSVVTVTVGLLADSEKDTTIAVCDGESIEFLGETLQAGDSNIFTLAGTASCDSIVTVTVEADPIESIADSTFNIVEGQFVNVNWLPQNSTYTYNWEATDGINCTDCANPVLSPTSTQTFNVTISNATGCQSSALVTVNVVEKSVNWITPNAFSPNNDGFNDSFRPQAIGVTTNYQLTVYNRWGRLVYSGNDPAVGWQGKVNGKEDAPIGAYIFYVRVQNALGELVEDKGNVTLVR